MTGRIGLETAAHATGKQIAAFSRPVEYEGYETGELRHAWTLQPDDEGRYHALTLRRQEDDASAWEVTADQPFATRNEAEAWAARLFSETE